MNKLFFDTETTGKYEFKLPPDHPSQPQLVQLACILEDDSGAERAVVNIIIKPEDWHISEEVVAIHGISDDIANSCGVTLRTAAFLFNNLCYASDLLVAHNINFDTNIMRSVFTRLSLGNRLAKMNRYCTMLSATPIVKVPKLGAKPSDRNYKWPKLSECMYHFFDDKHEKAHDAFADVIACRRVYHELMKHEGV